MTAFLAGLVFLAAGFVQGMTGFGSALVAVPLLTMFMDIKAVVPLCILNSIIITGYLVYQLRGHFSNRRILPLVFGSLPGIFVGALLLKRVDAGIIRILIGILLSGYGSYSLLVRPRSLGLGPAWGILAGFCSGAIGAAFSAGGPPTIIYTTLTNWKKDEIKATLTGFFAFNSVCIVLVHAFSGITTPAVLTLFAYTAPTVLLGTVLGAWASSSLGRGDYVRLIFFFLVIMGIMMIFL